jgi:hypothetical protein
MFLKITLAVIPFAFLALVSFFSDISVRREPAVYKKNFIIPHYVSVYYIYTYIKIKILEE